MALTNQQHLLRNQSKRLLRNPSKHLLRNQSKHLLRNPSKHLLRNQSKKNKEVKLKQYNFFLFYRIIAASISETQGFGGCRVLPSISGQGVYLQQDRNFYHFSCDTSSCQWETMEQTLPAGVTHGIFMYLSPDYNCN